MELKREQKDIISSTGDIRINVVAGSGMTTTIIEYVIKLGLKKLYGSLK